jgi:ribosomal protein L37E
MTGDVRRGSGDAWLDLAAELQQRLRERDPDARVRATVDPSGLLQLDIATAPAERAAAQAMGRRYEDTARSTCERCGERVTAVRAGPVVSIVCAHCCDGGPR